jgi:hypothetical protein
VTSTYKEEYNNRLKLIENKINFPINNNITDNLIAIFIETFPIAIGLYFFDGCFASDFLSKISFIIYVEETIKENPIKTIAISLKSWIS